MKTKNKLYHIVDLIEEIDKIDKMIEIHESDNSAFMLDQYNAKKLKLSGFLFKELLSKDSSSDAMHIIKLFIDKFYGRELAHVKFSSDDDFKKIEALVS